MLDQMVFPGENTEPAYVVGPGSSFSIKQRGGFASSAIDNVSRSPHSPDLPIKPGFNERGLVTSRLDYGSAFKA